jgi:hypothetical protein
VVAMIPLTTTPKPGPIMGAASVKAILEGRKVMTTRVIDRPWLSGISNLEIKFIGDDDFKILTACGTFPDGLYGSKFIRLPYEVGQTYYVKEAWASHLRGLDCIYGDDSEPGPFPGVGFRSPLFMPRWAARIFIEIKEVKVRRLWEMTLDDIWLEGVRDSWRQDINGEYWEPNLLDAQRSFAEHWDSINGKKHPWKSNPWVASYAFLRVQP